MKYLLEPSEKITRKSAKRTLPCLSSDISKSRLLYTAASSIFANGFWWPHSTRLRPGFSTAATFGFRAKSTPLTVLMTSCISPIILSKSPKSKNKNLTSKRLWMVTDLKIKNLSFSLISKLRSIYFDNAGTHSQSLSCVRRQVRTGHARSQKGAQHGRARICSRFQHVVARSVSSVA